MKPICPCNQEGFTCEACKSYQRKEKAICVILAYNCEDRLESTYTRIPKDSVDRIILCDDGSKDKTLEVAKRLGIEYYTHPNLGYGGNVKWSIQKCLELGANYIIELHGDGQYEPRSIPEGLEKAREGYDVVVGSRFFNWRHPLEDGMSWARFLANIGLSSMERPLLGLPLHEFHSGFRIYTKKFAETVSFEYSSDGHLFGFEAIAMAKFANLPIGEFPMRCDYKESHTSISIPHSIIYAFQTIGVLTLYRLAKLGVGTKLFGTKLNTRMNLSCT